MSFGLTFEKLLLIGLIAVFLIGPDRLPIYSAKLARLIRSLRDMASGAKDRLREEMGPDFDEGEWKKLDPRQYDPRRIVREALVDSATPRSQPVKPPRADEAPAAAAQQRPAGPAAAFDPDAV